MTTPCPHSKGLATPNPKETMNTHRYYTDAYTNTFTANITERVEENNKIAIILDQTYFYPTSGGQPHDTGTINGVAVVDVTVREADGAIVHWLAGAVDEGEITAVIDWQRRFDHMQQHTGQHILSQAFIQIGNAETVGFHLSPETVTIDLNVGKISPSQLEKVEQLANQIVFENRPINVRLVSLEEAHTLPLRKIPPTRDGRLRLVDIENFDLNACGGTHVDRTGGVGLIKIIKTERRNNQMRIEFCCGGRALADYGEKNALLLDLSVTLTTGYANVPDSVEKLREENKGNGRLLKKLRTDLLGYEAENLLKNAPLITRVFEDKDADDLRTLGRHLTQHDGVITLLGSVADGKVQLLFSRHADAEGDMNQLLRVAFGEIRGGGGGSASLAQGGGPLVEKTAVEQAIACAAEKLSIVNGQ